VTASYADATWPATSSAAWLTLSATTGTGSMVVTLTAAASTIALSRTTTVTIAGQTFTVTQAAGVATTDRPLALRVASITGNTVTLQWQWPGPSPPRYPGLVDPTVDGVGAARGGSDVRRWSHDAGGRGG